MKVSPDGPCSSKTMIGMLSIDYSCVYSIMLLVFDFARKYGHDPVLTFD